MPNRDVEIRNFSRNRYPPWPDEVSLSHQFIRCVGTITSRTKRVGRPPKRRQVIAKLGRSNAVKTKCACSFANSEEREQLFQPFFVGLPAIFAQFESLDMLDA